jgi:hypothetical protein
MRALRERCSAFSGTARQRVGWNWVGMDKPSPIASPAVAFALGRRTCRVVISMVGNVESKSPKCNPSVSHERHGVDGGASATNFEVQVAARGGTCASRAGNHLPCRHLLTVRD